MEARLYNYLLNNELIGQTLATYNGNPAVFLQAAPADEDPLWGNGEQYPRVVFGVDKAGDPERKVSATLTIDVTCTNNGTPAETIEPIIRQELNCHYFTQENDTIAAAWLRSDWYTGESDPNIHGVTVTFDVMHYPIQETGGLDTIALLNDWSETTYPNAKIIGRSNLPEVWVPTDTSPSIYWSMRTMGPGAYQGSAAVEWIGITAQGFVATPSEIVRRCVIKDILEKLNLQRRLIFADNSPLMFQRFTASMTADQIRAGQITITATYGIIKQDAPAQLLQHAFVADGRD